jgi:hypothetical protein
MVGSAEVGEIMMRAFILRRVGLKRARDEVELSETATPRPGPLRM